MTQSHGARAEQKEKGALRSDQDRLMFSEGFSFSGYERDPLYLNLGAGKFLDISGVSGIDSITDGRGAVFADFDNDGDLDVFLTTIQGPCHLLFRNNTGRQHNFLRVALQGTASGMDAWSALARVRTSAGTLTKIKSGGSGYLAQHDPRLLFGLGDDRGVGSIEVTWPSGRVEKFPGAAAGDSVLLREGGGEEPLSKLSETRTSLPDPLGRAEVIARTLRIRKGLPLPPIPARSISGKARMLADSLKPGRSTLVNLWATWCVPCTHEMPELERLRPSLAARGIDLVGLNLDVDPAADVPGFLERRKITYPNVLGGVPAIERLYATEQLFVPLTILVDSRGVVADVIPGWSAETRAKFGRLSREP